MYSQFLPPLITKNGKYLLADIVFEHQESLRSLEDGPGLGSFTDMLVCCQGGVNPAAQLGKGGLGDCQA